MTAVVGALALAVLARETRPDATGKGRRLTSWLSVACYVVIALVALFPTLPAEMGLTLAPIRVEAVLLSLLVFLGVNLAWMAMFEPVEPPAPPEGGASA